MCHAGAPQFLWHQAVCYAAHQLNLWPSDALPRVRPIFLWTGFPGVEAAYRVWGCLAHVRAPGTNKLSACTRACVFLGFPLDTSGWVFYDPVTHQFFASQDVTFNDPPQVALVAPPPSRPARSGVSHVTPQSSPPQRPVPVVSWGAGGAVAEGEGTGASGALGASSGGVGGVRVETTPEEDTGVLTQRPCPASPPGFPSVPQFPPRSPPRPVAVEPGGVPARGTGVPGGVACGGSGSGGAGARDTSTATPTLRTGEGGVGAWTRRSPLSRDVSPEPRRSHYRADGPFHLVIRSRVPPPPILPQPPESSLIVFHDPLSDYLRASRTVSLALPLPTVHLVSGPARSPFSGGAPVFPPEVLEDRQFELGFLVAAIPHLCTMLLAPEGDPDALDIPIPRNHAEAVSGPWASYWIAAKEAVMASYSSTGTYVDAVPPPGANVFSGMWLHKVKQLPRAPPVFKARYVARGFSQREGVDFFQTFAPTPKMTTLWAPREWHNTLRATLAALDLFPSSADPSLFVRRGSTPFFVLVYVDDLVFATPDRRALASVKEELQRRHTSTDLGELQHYLGILTRFCFPFSKVQPTPLAVDHGSTAPPSDEPFESSGPYPEVVGYLMVAKYVASTSGMGLVLGGKQPAALTGYLDSSWADDAESLRSTQGYCFSLGTGAVSWRSTWASSVSSSICEAEVYDAAMATFAGCLSSSPTLVSGLALPQSYSLTTDIFSKALPPCAHQRFCTQLGLVSTGPHLLA
ncbi:unnamed protein product [Closterium sp. NIES-53]